MEESDVRGKETEVIGEASGWVTTAVAARALRVTPRTIRTYIDQGQLDARSDGEGVRKTWLVSADSLQALRDRREASDRGRRGVRSSYPAESNAEDLFLEIANRLEIRAAEAGELKIRLEISERTRNILEEERRRLADDLKREREKAERWEQEFLEAQQKVERLTAELGEARQEALQLRAEFEQGKGFFRWRRPGG
jgi:predicted RNase H-like nuclease (RuvC/YqgF family)